MPKDEILNQKDLLFNLPDKNYKEELKKACLEIVLKNEPDTRQHNQEKIKNIQENYGYINLKDIDIESLNLNENDIIEKYRNKINKKEDKLVGLFNRADVTLEELVKEVSEQSKHELAKYIFHRDIVPKKANFLNNAKEKEEVLHNLFFPQ